MNYNNQSMSAGDQTIRITSQWFSGGVYNYTVNSYYNGDPERLQQNDPVRRYFVRNIVQVCV